MEPLYITDHAAKKHRKEKWNAETILKAYERNQLRDVEHLTGTTADVILATAPDRSTVGLLISKVQQPNERHPHPYRVVITGFSAPADYWRRQVG